VKEPLALRVSVGSAPLGVAEVAIDMLLIYGTGSYFFPNVVRVLRSGLSKGMRGSFSRKKPLSTDCIWLAAT